MIDKKVALCLGGGSSLGFAHIGVLKALIENSIPIDIITGTSMGAIVGGVYALTQDIETMEKSALEVSRAKLTDIRLFPLGKNSILVGKKADEYLKKLYGEDTRIEDCKMPFGVVSVDLVHGNLEYMTDGLMWESIRASMSVPGVFSPVEKDDKLLVDGGIVENVPVNLAKKMGAEIIIAVDVVDYDVIKASNKKMIGVLFNSFHASQLELNRLKVQDANIIIKPDLKGLSMLDFKRELTEKAIIAGYDKTIEMMPEIKKILQIDN